MSARLLPLLSALAIGAATPLANAAEQPGTVLVLDASGSMWGQIDGQSKIVIARQVIADILSGFPADQHLGLVTYGHRERGQCSDIETIVAPAAGTAGEISRIVDTLNPRGMTPMADALVIAAEALRHTEQAATVILVSDGIETCNPDPCAAAKRLADGGVQFTAHVIGFDVREEAEALAQMRCIAEETGGRFLTADNARQLSDALQQVVVELEPVAEPEPEAAPEPELPEATVNAPAEIVVGSEFAVSWEAEGLNPRDYVTIVPAGAEVGAYGSYDRIEDGRGGRLRAPAEPGLYEVRLQLDSGERVLASTPVEVLEGNVSVRGPERVRAETEMQVSWEGAIHPHDYVTIVPEDAAEGDYGKFVRVNDASAGKLVAPAEPGLYELRYHLDQGSRVMARWPVEVLAADAPLDEGAALVVPESGRAGETIQIAWTGGADSADQRVALARADQPEFSWISVDSAIGRNSLEIRLPETPGIYEVRFLDIAGRKLLGRSIIRVEP